MTSTPNNTPNKGRSLDRQITTQDVDCLREAFALFNNDRKDEITSMELGKVIHFTSSYVEVDPFLGHCQIFQIILKGGRRQCIC